MAGRVLTLDTLEKLAGPSNLTQAYRNHIKRLSALHDTPHMRRLVEKLEDAGLEGIYNEGVELARAEGLDTSGFEEVDLMWVKVDLGKNGEEFDYQARKTMIEDVEESLLGSISFYRLDWTWDFAWSYYLWPASKFNDNILKLYGLVRGDRPRGLHQRPYQFVLNHERKKRIRSWETKIARAAIRGLNDRVLELSKSPEAITRTKAPKLVASD